jgi:hypothetical protein
MVLTKAPSNSATSVFPPMQILLQLISKTSTLARKISSAISYAAIVEEISPNRADILYLEIFYHLKYGMFATPKNHSTLSS